MAVTLPASMRTILKRPVLASFGSFISDSIAGAVVFQNGLHAPAAVFVGLEGHSRWVYFVVVE